MPATFSIPRLRWKYRRMRLKRWLLQPHQPFLPNDPLCEVDTDDGVIEVRLDVTEPGWILGHWSEPGESVSVMGELVEWSVNGPIYGWHRGQTKLTPVLLGPSYCDIFISYRRKDTAAVAGRLHETLAREFTEARVFLDIFSMRSGDSWRAAAQQAATNCRAMIVLIGEKWERTRVQGHRRLDLSTDIVRREVVAGLDRPITVIPTLVERRHVPHASVLPLELRPLADLHMGTLATRTWTSDVAALLKVLRLSLT